MEDLNQYTGKTLFIILEDGRELTGTLAARTTPGTGTVHLEVINEHGLVEIEPIEVDDIIEYGLA